jgi:crotonobetainyl-CoA:carnitine CoA-transferase CaiB-like acyl-CoA transferase
MTTNRQPLEGIRVLDLSNLLAGPMSTMHLADYGADVIKVEHPERGDEMRKWGLQKDGVGLFFKVINRNKRTITIDLGKQQGRDLVRKLAAEVDIVVENFRTGTVERWGIGYDDLVAANPDLIMVHLTGFGRTGPLAHEPGFGSLVEAFAGAAYVNGHDDREPLIQPFGLGDASAAIFAAFAVMVAVYNRDQGHGGQEIDLGLYEGLFTMLGPQVINYDQLGVIQERYGADNPFVAPRGTYKTRDGHWVAISGSTQATFERICRALELDWVLTDDRFSTNASRVANGGALTDLLREAIVVRDRDDLVALARKHQATMGPVNNVADMFTDGQVQARGNLIEVEDAELGPVRMQNVAIKFSETPGRVTHTGPPKAAFNDEVFRELLGLGEEEIQRLKDTGVI